MVSDRRRRLAALPAIWLAAGPLSAATSSKRSAPPPFERVELRVPADYTLSPASTPSVDIEAEPAVLERIQATVQGDRLTIVANGSFNTREPLRIRIGFTRLRRIDVRAAADVSLTTLRGDRLAVDIDTAADVTLKSLNLTELDVDIKGSASVTADGQAEAQRIQVRGSGTFDGSALKSAKAKVDVDGAGDADLDASRDLQVSIRGSGTVRYAGSPKLSQRIEGSGSLERK